MLSQSGGIFAAAVSIAAAALVIAPAREASACGGCFVPEGPSTQVSAHRMAFAVSATRTVLWDQIQYVGSPSEFGWVLPIRGKVDVGVSSDQLFQRLEETTAPQVTPPPAPTCPEPEKRCRTSCYEVSDAGAFAAAEDTGSVDIWSTTVVGPYEATQLSATDGTALRNWLTNHAYVLPASIGPVVDKYIAEGFGFLVIKLVPQASDNRMVPIRIGFDGASPTLPLRMIAAGAGAKIGIKLFVLGDGRWEAKNFGNAELRTADLVWDWQAMGSNLGPLEISLINNAKGNVFITETSEDVRKSSLLAGLPPGTVTTEAGTTFSSITDQTELDAAFPGKELVRATRLFAELPQSLLASDLELQASVEGVVPRVRQAPRGVNYTCPQVIEVQCAGVSPSCGGGENPADGETGSSGSGFGCRASSSSSPGSLGWAGAAVAALAVVSSVRRRVTKGK